MSGFAGMSERPSGSAELLSNNVHKTKGLRFSARGVG